jgi:dethiobiotin synthetase
VKFSFPKRFFVTGTDTEVGKTVVCAMLTLGLRGVYWKPVQSGTEVGSDRAWVQQVSGLGTEHFRPEAYTLRQPLSPHAAAALEGVRLELERFVLPVVAAGTHLIVEGAGGVLVPLNEEDTMLDLMAHLGLPVLIVARSTLGTINHTLLSLAALRRRGLEILGVVLNGPSNAGNREAIEHFGRTRVVAQLEPLATLGPESLALAYAKLFGRHG